ncbi:MAG: class SAM-dependent methyltransferase [Burkholderia sp.]|nr:class SAM-dependent methyltransferase [Burkholderia sp.]
MKNAINADSRLIPVGGFVSKLRSSQRRRLLDAFASFTNDASDDSILDVGMMPIPLFDTREYLSAWTVPRNRSRITSYKIAPPGSAPSRFRPQGPGGSRSLPYGDGQFDWVFCGETIEHAGNYEQQYALVQELTRVARKGVFVTTSNRRHPIEFNTALPLVHWLPDAWRRRVLTWSGRAGWASESVLNLLDSRALYRIASELPGQPKSDVGHKRVFGMKAHFFLMIEKA